MSCHSTHWCKNNLNKDLSIFLFSTPQMLRAFIRGEISTQKQADNSNEKMCKKDIYTNNLQRLYAGLEIKILNGTYFQGYFERAAKGNNKAIDRGTENQCLSY